MILGADLSGGAAPLGLLGLGVRGPQPEVLYEKGTKVDFMLEALHLTKRRVSGGVVVRAPPEAVWNVLTDYERMPEVIPNILSNRVTRDERARRVTIQQESLLSNKLQLRVDMELEAIEQRDRWSLALRRLSGHGFLQFQAQYSLKPRPDGTTYLSYEVELVPCPIFPLPLVERKVRKEVPKMLYAVGLASALTVEESPAPVSLKIIPGFSVEPLKGGSQNCHYADPYQQACKSDEVSAEIQAQPTNLKICVSPCSTDADCPTDVCPGVTSTPRCFLQAPTGQKYCGLPCMMSQPVKCSTDEHMVCEPAGSAGICGYAS